MTEPTGIPTLETMRLRLREWRESDIEPLGRILADPEVTRHLFDGKSLDADEVRAAYDRRIASWRDRGIGLWALESKESGGLVGWAGLQHVPAEEGYVDEVEVAWTLDRAWWRRGLATEAAAECLAYGFSKLGLERIYAFHAPGNLRSERVIVRLGMEPAGSTVDLRDGAVSHVHMITAEQWAEKVESSGKTHPHYNAGRVAEVLGYEAHPGGALLSRTTRDSLRDALLAALVRSWPGQELPGEPRLFEADGEPADLGVRISAERSKGLLPLLVVASLDEPAAAGALLPELHREAAREGVWLHADLAVRHGTQFESLSHADSIAFDIPTPRGPRRLFATRHPRILDDAFLVALEGGDTERETPSARMSTGP